MASAAHKKGPRRMARSKLLIFPHSHFCEKARWALDYKNVDHDVQALVPGLHVLTVKSKGCAETSVPVFLHNGEALQGFDQIVEHLAQHYPENNLIPQSDEDRVEAQAIEAQMDALLGKSIRTILYSTLLDHHAFVHFCFTHGMSSASKGVFKLLAPVVRKKIYQTYVRSSEYVEKAHSDFAQGMSELDERVATRKHLVGDRFSRTDIAVASLLSLIVLPKEHPFPWDARGVPSADAQGFINKYRDTAGYQWAERIYAEYR